MTLSVKSVSFLTAIKNIPQRLINGNLKFSNLIIDEWSPIKKYIINRAPVGIPAIVEFNLTNYCNLYCKFCPLKPPAEKKIMPISLLKKAINDISCYNKYSLLAFSGFCEPTLYPFIKQAIAFASKKGFMVALHTNGTTIDKKEALFFKKLGASFIIVSAYSKKILHKWLHNVGVKIKYNHIQQYFSNRAGAFGKSHKNNPCFYSLYSIYINYDGEVFYCPHNFFNINSIGNIKDENLASLWSSNKTNEIRFKLINGQREFEPCAECSVDGTLMGGKNVQILRTSQESLAAAFKKASKCNKS